MYNILVTWEYERRPLKDYTFTLDRKDELESFLVGLYDNLEKAGDNCIAKAFGKADDSSGHHMKVGEVRYSIKNKIWNYVEYYDFKKKEIKKIIM